MIGALDAAAELATSTGAEEFHQVLTIRPKEFCNFRGQFVDGIVVFDYHRVYTGFSPVYMPDR